MTICKARKRHDTPREQRIGQGRGGRAEIRLVSMRAAMLCLALTLALSAPLGAQDTERVMLSGAGPDDAVLWNFEIDGGRGAGKTTKIAVPSNWQQQGFGHYQYGYDKGPRSADHAVYRRRFSVPAGWNDKTVRIVFDAVMTDTQVKVNGIVAGPLHQGGFNRFSYDITRLVKPGAENTLEVEVSESSAATDTDIAERHGDYWVFGGIYRPVWLEAAPAQSISHLAIDAQASGVITADVTLSAPRTVTRIEGRVIGADGEMVGKPFDTALPSGGAGRVRLEGKVERPALWSAETPNLYTLDVTLYEGETRVHHLAQRFGFRTFEVRDGEGLYLNGQRLLLKGVNRHSFMPETGRTISRAQAYQDVRDIRAMNMNAVRMSHYSPEEAFLEAADELGLYVIDELSGWQHAHDTEIGRKLVRELVERDVNHPSIVLWTNGNEGGWNRELDGDFALHDPQGRSVLHPWETFGGIDTKHYPRYPDLLRRLDGDALVMPTEFLHGLFDGGAGAGLEDYWTAITASPRGAGGFLWNYRDEGIARKDQGDRIDTYAAYAPDGIVGPNGEKEASWWTVRDVWSPVQIAAPRLDANFDGTLRVQNQYDFTALDQVDFTWEWVRFASPSAKGIEPAVLASGTLKGPPLAPHGEGSMQLPLPRMRGDADALRLIASKGDEPVWTWVWPRATTTPLATGKTLGTPQVERKNGALVLSAGPASASFDPSTGMLTRIAGKGASMTLNPALVLARAEVSRDNEQPEWVETSARAEGIYEVLTPMLADAAQIDLGRTIEDGWASFTLEVSEDGRNWQTVYSGARTAKDGQDYAFTPRVVRALRITGLAGVRSTPTVRTVSLSGTPERYTLPAPGPVSVSSGTGVDPSSGEPIAYVESHNAQGLDTARWTLHRDGRLTLDYAYSLSGSFLYHGLGFSAPDLGVTSAKALVRGPSAVWKNRMRGTEPGVYEIATSTPTDTSISAGPRLPSEAGYFADPRWVRLATAHGPLTIASEGAAFLQLGARPADFPTTTVAFPSSTFGFLNAIPAMGAKGQAAALTGPAGEPAKAEGQYSGRLTFSLQ